MRVFISIITAFLLLTLVACSSVDSDAKKAANLKKESQECIRENDLEKAEQLFNESQTIIDQYRNTDNYDEFYDRFLEYSKTNGGSSK